MEPLVAEAQAEFEGVKLTVAPVFKVTVVVVEAEQPLFVTVTVYVPAFTAVILAIVGFCKLEVNPLGPDQE
jgi:hypothetical protein